jgi:hypothetical protein
MSAGTKRPIDRRLAPLGPWLVLAVITPALLWPLGLTNRILAGIDALTYFTPYWAYRMAALRSGQIPLWNPYLFLGVPFLANPQAAVLYPLHWPLSWLEPAQALVWSALLHVWLAAGFAYLFARRSLGLTQLASLLTGLLFGLGGYTLARVENINQLNALAWFPALLWLYDEVLRARDRRHALRWGLALAAVIALVILAGHTQTAFLDLAGLALYAVVPIVQDVWTGWGRGPLPQPLPDAGRGAGDTSTGSAGEGEDSSPLLRREDGDDSPFPRREGGWGGRMARLLPLLAILPAVGLAAAQLWPTLELNNLGLRTGGLSFRQAVSFSLRPRLLAQSLLPPFRSDLGATFGSEGYAEFVGYLGVVALMLAVIGLVYSLRSPAVETLADAGGSVKISRAARQARRVLPWLAVAGLLLALGGYNPLYYLLWRFVPGFALFRAPARWLALYVIGMAGLAGAGLDQLAGTRTTGSADATTEAAGRGPRKTRAVWIAGGCGLALVGLALTQQWPRWPVMMGWLAAGLAGAGLWWLGRSRPGARHLTRVGLFLLVLAELWLGGRALPFAQATAPAATGMRNAPAALLAATAGQPPAGRDRFLSLSDIRFDPGDLAELRGMQAGLLPVDAIERFIRAAKQMEVLAPNLSLLLKLPAVDGYDGGVLPLARYVKLQSLFFPPGAGASASPDGRLREQLRAIPPDRLLDLTATRYVVTDKQNDLWSGDVYYDLEQPVNLAPGATLTLDLAGYPPFSATAIGVVSYLSQAVAPGTAVARIEMAGASGGPQEPGAATVTRTLTVTAGADTAWAQEMHPVSPIHVARAWPDWQGPGKDYLAVKDLAKAAGCTAGTSGQTALGPAPCAVTPATIRITALPISRTTALTETSGTGGLTLRGLSLIDRRTGAHQSITLSPRGDVRRIYSGDVKVYERSSAPGRAWLVHDVQRVPDDATALIRLADPAFVPRTTAIVTAQNVTLPGSAAGAAPAGQDQVATVSYTPERVELVTTSAAPALLVVADAIYPGWTAAVDGQPAPLWTADLMLRGIPVPPGRHEVTLTYRPRSWQTGLIVSLLTLAACGAALLVTLRRPAP